MFSLIRPSYFVWNLQQIFKYTWQENQLIPPSGYNLWVVKSIYQNVSNSKIHFLSMKINLNPLSLSHSHLQDTKVELLCMCLPKLLQPFPPTPPKSNGVKGISFWESFLNRPETQIIPKSNWSVWGWFP